MNPKEIGLVALFRGVETLVGVVKRPREEIEAFTHLVNHDSVPCFGKLAKTLRDVVKDIGLAQTAHMLSLTEEVLMLIIGEHQPRSDSNKKKISKNTIMIEEESKLALIKDNKSLQKLNVAVKSKQDIPAKSHNPTASTTNTLNIATNSAPSVTNHNTKFTNSATNPNPIKMAPKAVEYPYKVSPLTAAFEEFKSRVTILYEAGVKSKVIMVLYDIRNATLINTIGN